MKLRLPNSPKRLALLSVLGLLLASFIFVAPLPRNHHGGLFGAYLILSFAVFAAGAFLSLKCTSTLRHGVENQEWPDSQIESLRRHLESPWYTALSIALLIAFVLFEFMSKKRFGGEGWVCFLISQDISQLRIAVRRPRPSKPSGPIPDWRDFAPIHSDHWGSR
jgi:hypothetical protein